MRQVDLAGVHIEANHGAPVLLLREQDAPHRLLPVFIGENEAAAIVLAVSGQAPPRPMTHDLMAALVTNLGGVVESVEITELRNDAFIAQLAISGPTGAQLLDTRPSDAIALAVRLGTPIFVTASVLDAAGVVVVEEADGGDGPPEGGPTPSGPGAPIDEATMDEVIAAFRSMLDELDPADFLPPSEPRADADGEEPGSDRPAGSP